MRPINILLALAVIYRQSALRAIVMPISRYMCLVWDCCSLQIVNHEHLTHQTSQKFRARDLIDGIATNSNLIITKSGTPEILAGHANSLVEPEENFDVQFSFAGGF